MRQRQVAVGDRAAEGALLLGPLDVDVDPLVVAGGVGEQVHLLLRDLDVVAVAEVLTHEVAEAVDSLHDGGHAGDHARGPRARTQPTCAPSCWPRARGGAAPPADPPAPQAAVPGGRRRRCVDLAARPRPAPATARRRRVAVNVHHGREAIEAHLDRAGSTSRSRRHEALGTAGALGHLRPWIDGRGVAGPQRRHLGARRPGRRSWPAGTAAGSGWLAGGDERLGPDQPHRRPPSCRGRRWRGWRRCRRGCGRRRGGRWPTPAESTSSAGTGRASTAAPRPATWPPTWPPAAGRR